jgi:protease I
LNARDAARIAAAFMPEAIMLDTHAGDSPLKGRRIAIVATHGFEQSELTEPRAALDRAGATTVVIAPKAGSIRGWKHKEWGD